MRPGRPGADVDDPARRPAVSRATMASMAAAMSGAARPTTSATACFLGRHEPDDVLRGPQVEVGEFRPDPFRDERRRGRAPPAFRCVRRRQSLAGSAGTGRGFVAGSGVGVEGVARGRPDPLGVPGAEVAHVAAGFVAPGPEVVDAGGAGGGDGGVDVVLVLGAEAEALDPDLGVDAVRRPPVAPGGSEISVTKGPTGCSNGGPVGVGGQGVEAGQARPPGDQSDTPSEPFDAGAAGRRCSGRRGWRRRR